MAAESDQDPDVFEIDDFTAASDWERFIYRIEEIIGPHGWKLDKNHKKQKLSQGSELHTLDLKENLQFNHRQFYLCYHKSHGEIQSSQEVLLETLPQALHDSFDFNFDFLSRGHILNRCFGIKEFIVLLPASNEAQIEGESEMKLLWSSLGIALSNLNCQTPIFIQVGPRNRSLFYGLCIGEGFRSSYETIHLKYTPHECNHIQGMIETFRSKLSCPIQSNVIISVRFSYIINDWPEEMWCQELPNIENEFEMQVGINSFEELPFGPLQEPVIDLMLAVTWPQLSSDMINDDAHFSDLDPMQAPHWSLKARFMDFCPTLLFEQVKALLHLCHHSSGYNTAQILRTSHRNDQNNELTSEVSHVLDRLTKPAPSLSPLSMAVSRAAMKAINTNVIDSPLPEELLNKALNLLFPDAHLMKEEACKLQASLSEQQRSLESDTQRLKDRYRHLKGAPTDSLTLTLACCIMILNHSYGGMQAIAHLWHEFVRELRFRYENKILVPKLAQNPPNHNYCLIHQKLQMLNCCILKHQQRMCLDETLNKSNDLISQNKNEVQHNTPQHSTSQYNTPQKRSVSYKEFSQNSLSMDNSVNLTPHEFCHNALNEVEPGSSVSPATQHFKSDTSESHESDSDDEFFEVEESFAKVSTVSINDVENFQFLKREGVLKETSMKLLETNEVLCIPITQESSPLTEDMLNEQQLLMEKLGTSAEASKSRVRMQCASLLADMEAFKAANPGCILPDFVRWHSPNDWLLGPETDEEREELKKMTKERKDDSKDWSNKGHLSLRMRVPGNTWEEVWNTAKAVPARKQKRLFDDTKEAEKVLHFLTNLTLPEILLYLFPVFVQASLTRICKEEDSINLHLEIESLLKKSSKLQVASIENLKLMEDIVNHIHYVEMTVGRAKSLRMKLFSEDVKADSMESFLKKLLNKDEVLILGGRHSQIGGIVTKLLQHQKEENDSMFSSSKETNNRPQTNLSSTHKDIPYPFGREYIFRTTVPRPSRTSRLCPQRMYTAITPDDFRMAGCFTQDTNFL
ncbi:rab3 GTPase-activating protein catalytic subunit isoform X1 [Hydra vulgaris]|uniref:rab3 GTPase-activating protein catalytic subunit isoform X1 n=2 Tax=Hydra vulgaris TaxID=6087 RepID=UPI001F5FBD96|nr:rab3 GTPase-activating protein catalytic subunit isoform X1 [Hydra vulgaris]